MYKRQIKGHTNIKGFTVVNRQLDLHVLTVLLDVCNRSRSHCCCWAKRDLLVLTFVSELKAEDAFHRYMVRCHLLLAGAIKQPVFSAIRSGFMYLHCVLKKRPPFYSSNNSVKNEPILMIFCALNPEKI